jgi:hypothetical protein
MADKLAVHSASALIYTGKGQLNGFVISCTSTTPALATFYDGINDGGTKMLEVNVASPYPVIIFFSEHLRPTFVTGLYLKLAANLTATVWSRQV